MSDTSKIRAACADADAPWYGSDLVPLMADAAAKIDRLRADLAQAKEREGKLREALRGLLLSADASWEEGDRGHDWRESCERARALLAEEGKP